MLNSMACDPQFMKNVLKCVIDKKQKHKIATLSKERHKYFDEYVIKCFMAIVFSSVSCCYQGK